MLLNKANISSLFFSLLMLRFLLILMRFVSISSTRIFCSDIVFVMIIKLSKKYWNYCLFKYDDKCFCSSWAFSYASLRSFSLFCFLSCFSSSVVYALLSLAAADLAVRFLMISSKFALLLSFLTSSQTTKMAFLSCVVSFLRCISFL